MQLIRLNAHATNHHMPASVVTIGNFDGVHLGHRAMIAKLKQVAEAKQLKSVVMIFEPQPLEFFQGYAAPPRLSSLREKVEYLSELGVDYVAVAAFNARFRNMSADDFAQLLRQQLHAQSLVLGDDFHFGKNRQGDSAFLAAAGFDVVNLQTIRLDGERVSSTRIREVLAQGDLQLAAQLLGRPYSIVGRVQYGDQIGRTIDFPTINVGLNRHKPCLHGIYVVDVHAEDAHLPTLLASQNSPSGIAGYRADSLIGAGHVGTRPAIAQAQPQWRLEVHFPHVQANLYGRLMRVTFLQLLHEELPYNGLAELKAGILQDVEDTLNYRLAQHDFPFNPH